MITPMDMPGIVGLAVLQNTVNQTIVVTWDSDMNEFKGHFTWEQTKTILGVDETYALKKLLAAYGWGTRWHGSDADWVYCNQAFDIRYPED